MADRLLLDSKVLLCAVGDDDARRQVADCSVLCSQDMQHGQLIDGQLTIVNPFAA